MGLKYREKARFGAFYSGSSKSSSAYCPKTGRLFCVYGDCVTVVERLTGRKSNEILLEGDVISAVGLSPGIYFWANLRVSKISKYSCI